MNPKTWIRRHGSCRGSWDAKMLRHEPGDMDLAEDPEIHTDADLWILQRILRYKDAETWIRRHGSCRGPWDIKMLRHESETWILQRILRYIWMLLYTDPEKWILQRFLRYIWMLRHEPGDMDLAEDPEIHMDADIWIRRHGSCRGSWDIKMLRHESGDMDLAEDPKI